MPEAAPSAEETQPVRKPWIAPVVESLDISDGTLGGGITDILENGFYHT